jgi:hypothetical protein
MIVRPLYANGFRSGVGREPPVKIVTANRGEETKSCVANEIVFQVQVAARLVNHDYDDTGNKQAAKQEEIEEKSKAVLNTVHAMLFQNNDGATGCRVATESIAVQRTGFRSTAYCMEIKISPF